MGEGMRMLAQPGHGLGKVLGCGLLVHGILPYATWPRPAASTPPLPRQTLSFSSEMEIFMVAMKIRLLSSIVASGKLANTGRASRTCHSVEATAMRMLKMSARA